MGMARPLSAHGASPVRRLPYHRSMTTTQAELDPPPADRALVATQAAPLGALAAQHGISALRFASPGRLVGHLADDRDLLDVIEFELAAGDLLGAPVSLFSDAVLTKGDVSPDLIAAQPL